jgi:hypothetical protein
VVVLFLRPFQLYVLAPLLGARRPTPDEAALLDTAWRPVLQVNDLPRRRYVLAVLPSNELNAFACGGHLVVVTSYAIEALPRDELSGARVRQWRHALKRGGYQKCGPCRRNARGQRAGRGCSSGAEAGWLCASC